MDADVVMFVYRPERYDITEDSSGRSMANVAEIIVGKQRNGPTGTVRLTFLKDYARFENLAKDAGVGQPPMGGPPEDFGGMGPDDTPF